VGPAVTSQGIVVMSHVLKRLIDGVSLRFDESRLPMDLKVFDAMVLGDG
jgi:hypothetical protein